ncbi:MAG: amino acid adenylation domain-containing protein [Colwellia sp.]|nr:amino acid adenylation domain-containing protein [Colwellia sp.]
MNDKEIIEELAFNNIDLYLVEDCKLKAKAPKGAITSELASIIKENKNSLVKYLQQLDNIIVAQSRSTIRQVIKRDLDKVPVSFAQQRLWFIDSLQGGSPEYNMPMAFEIEGQLNTTLLTDVFHTILERHEVLRTVYVEEDGETLQYIRNISDIVFEIKIEELSHLTGETLNKQLETMFETDITTPFDLASDLMLRVSYVKKTTDTGVMIFNMHHIASDGWSMEVLIKEFFTLYHAYSQGQVNPLPDLEIQYADYAHWQREYLEGEVLESQLGYWEKQLDELPALHSLPLDHTRPAMKQHEGAIVTGELPATTAKQLLAVAKEHKLTPFMLLHGALSLLLSRHSNSADIVIGTPVANRLQAELEPLIGFFVNTLVLRADTNHDSLSDYFTHIRQIHLDAQSNQDVPFEQLVERLKAPRSTAHSPLFQIMMTTDTDYGLNDESDIASFTLPGVDIQPYESDLNQAKFDIEIDLSISEQGVGLHWTFDVSLFTEQHITRLNDHLCRLLEGLSQTQGQPSQAPHDLPLLSTEEIEHLVHDLNDTAMDYPKDKCIHSLFEQQAEDNPDNVAVVFEDTQLTYKQLNEKANQLAHYLKEHYEIKPDTLVGLCVERSLDMVIGLMGILKAGGAYVPLDPSYPQERLSYMLADAALDVVLSQTQVQTVLAGFKGTILTLDELGGTDNHFCSEYGGGNLTTAETGLTSSHLAYVIYTSGSTGKPKGVELAHQSVLNYLTNTQDYLRDEVKHSVMSTSLNFDATVTSLFGAWLSGGYLTLLDEAKDIFDTLGAMMAKEEAALFKVTPSHLQGLVFNEPILTPHVVVVGGEVFSYDLAVRISKQMPNTYFINEYGPTESTVGCSYERFTYDDIDGYGERLDIHIGQPIINNQFFVLNEYQALLPHGSTGELYIGGDSLARGYLNRSELTVERFIENPFYDATKSNSSARLYRTGDLVRYLLDGNLEFIGRADDQVKIRGFRIELGEVETQLAQLESVDSALVMTKELAGSQQLVGYVKPLETITETEQAEYVAVVKTTLGQQLPDYMIPSIIMVIDAWSLTPNGKVDRKALPAPDGSAMQGEYVAPITDTERALVDIWTELLNIEADSISTTASFFELGGHSLLSVKLMSLIHTRFEKACELSVLFSKTTIQSQGIMLDSLERGLHRTELLYKVNDCIAPTAGIIFIPGVASTAKDFMEIVKYLQQSNVKDVEIGIFRHKGLIAGEQYFKTIEENVTAFVDSIASLPFKQITLVGHSYGGVLALELANHLKIYGYEVELVMLDTYFEQQTLDYSKSNQPTHHVDLNALNIPCYLQDLYQHQSHLFNTYEPLMDEVLPTTVVFANQSPFTQRQYMGYLEGKFLGQKMDYTSVDGDHFSMLKGKSAELISKIINNKGNHNVA